VRREGKKLVTYTHFGTGNYHPITARFYTDLSLFTCAPSYGRDATRVFNFVSGYARPEALEHLSISPLDLKETLLNCIGTEMAHAENGKPAEIWAKMNSVIDPDVIDALYRASQAGVRINLIIRGICGLRPGIAGLSENIQVKSIVGRFLEHSRIVCFANGKSLPSKKARVFISSADWMVRNLSRRVETLVEVSNPTVQAQIMSQIMAANLADQASSWVLQPNGEYIRHKGDQDSELFSCHKFFMENPSLSGRGSAGAKDVPELTHSKD
jgi:polyphosphate kinase